jgi:GntR family transcriptional regulator
VHTQASPIPGSTLRSERVTDIAGTSAASRDLTLRPGTTGHCVAMGTVYTVYMKYGFVFAQTDRRPMYQQIMDQIRQRIAVGDWPPDTPLPSVRELAADIKVSVITVKRAYLELVHEDVIVTQQGKGTWVNGSLDMDRLQRQELAEHLEQAGKLARSLAIPERELVQMLKKYT